MPTHHKQLRRVLTIVEPVAIYIPTLGRVEKQRTYKRLPSDLREHTWLVVDKSEAKDHTKRGRKVIVSPAQGHGLTAVRQWIIENTPYPRILLLDDDLYFYRRIAPDSWHLRTNSSGDTRSMVQMVDRLLCRGYVHAGISPRQKNLAMDWQQDKDGNWVQTRAGSYGFFGRAFMAFGFVAPALRALGVRFRTQLMSDFDTTLQLLRLGYVNPMLSEWCVNQLEMQSKGGCSLYRTPAMLKAISEEMVRLHTPYVQAVTKRTKEWGGKEEFNERTDVRVQWQRAWEEAPYKHGDHTDPAFRKLLSTFHKNHALTRDLFGNIKVCSFGHAGDDGVERELMIHEFNQAGKVRHRDFSLMEWARSLADKSVICRWTHKRDLDCKLQ